MLRQLQHLTRPLPAAGARASAIAVYADALDRAMPAADMGFEGVACVDDAARAVVLLLDVWEATRSRAMLEWAKSLVDFLIYMQRDDGQFVNFIHDWNGLRNDTGPTSVPGGGFWHGRGVRALAKAAVLLDDRRAERGLARGLDVIRAARDVPADIRSLHALTAIELLRAGRMRPLRADLASWVGEIASLRNGDVLLDARGQIEPHLWGHVQEGVLTDAGALLHDEDLVDIARRSAVAYLAPLIESRFDLPTVQPYGVASAVYSVDRLHAATGDPLFADLAAKARAWFDGRNTAGRPVYDRSAGRVHDGIDDAVLNPHSGAESNIVGAQALIADVIRDTIDSEQPMTRTA